VFPGFIYPGKQRNHHLAARKSKPSLTAIDRRSSTYSHEGEMLREASRLHDPETPANGPEGVTIEPVLAPEYGCNANAGEDQNQDFRQSRRTGLISQWLYAARRRGWAGMLPLLLVFAGTISALFLAGNAISAGIITFLTSALAVLCMMITNGPKTNTPGEMQRRFETLEDAAWELRESEERYRTMVEAFGDLMVVRNSSGQIMKCSAAYAECIGKPLEEVITSNIDLFPPSSKAKAGGGPLDISGDTREIRVETQAGERWFQVLDVPVRDDAIGGTAILSVARDITGFKRTEKLQADAARKAEEASRSKSRFLAMVSHEMRTPLNGIVGMSKLLGGTELTPEQASYNAALERSGKTLLHLIEDMLDLTMIEAGRFEIREETFELRPMLGEIVELMSHQAFDKNNGIGLFVDPALPETVNGDQDRLRQILLNLVGNALKFTSVGGVEVHCEPGKSGDQPDAISFTVRDTGPGMKAADRERIFGEFERVDNTITRQVSGAGLGLAISRALAKELNGRLELVKSDKTGSVFELEVPLQNAADRVSRVSLRPGLENLKVLMVSGNQVEANCIMKSIRSHGASVRLVKNAKMAAKLLKNATEPYDRIVFDPKDWAEPEKQAAKILELARTATGAKGASLTVLLPPDQRSRLAGFKNAGAQSWLIRPVRENSLLSVLQGRQFPDNRMKAKPSRLAAPVPLKNQAGILLVEDNDVNALLATSALKKAGFQVTRAVNGQEAVERRLEALKNGPTNGPQYGVILMDMHMPVLDGFSAVRQIRAMEKAENVPPMPIFALTADDQSLTRSNILKAGANGLLVKPVDPEKLVELVAGHLSA